MKRIEVPSLEDITAFYRDVFRKSQMETDCIIMTLIYVERLIRRTEGRLRPRSSNWRSILFSCMILASKVWDDLSMWVSELGCLWANNSQLQSNEFYFAVSYRTLISVKLALLGSVSLCNESMN